MSSPEITEGAGDGDSPAGWDKSRKKEGDLLPQDEDSAKGMGSAQETQRGSVLIRSRVS